MKDYFYQPKIIGFPYEEGSFWRKGSKEGPERVINQLLKMREYSIMNGKISKWKIKELISETPYLSPYDRESSMKVIEESIYKTLSSKRIPVSIGGDHSITYPIIKAFSKYYGKKTFNIIQIDAHSDTFANVDDYKYHHGATFRNIIEDELVEPHGLYQFGIRGQVREDSLDFVHEYNIQLINMMDFIKGDLNINNFIQNKDAYYYVSIDIDAIDPAFAPGTGTPVPGGLTSREILRIINQLQQLNIIGLDLVEVAPVYDSSDITTLLASNILYECINGIDFCRINSK